MADLNDIQAVQPVKLVGNSSTGVETSPVNSTVNGDLLVADLINTNGQNRAQSITSTPTEALGGSVILANRKMLSIMPTDGIVYWGYTSGVTTISGTPIFKNQNIVFSVGTNIHIYLVTASTVNCRIAEGS